MFTLTAIAGDGKVDLTWPTVTKARKYRVRRDGGVISTIEATQLTDSGLTNGTTYAYLVAALDRRGNRIDTSDSVAATPKSPAPFQLPALVGHGKAVTGGGSAIPQKVTTIEQALEAIQDSGSRVIYGDGAWLMGPAAGQTVKVGDGDLTLVQLSLGRTHLNFRGLSNVRLHDWRCLPNVKPDVDALTVNGQSSDGPVEGFAVSNAWLCGGTDIGGAAILGPVFDITLQHTVVGPGLAKTLGSDERDHNRVFNFTTFGDHADGPWGKRQTTWECLVWGGMERNPDIKYVEANDFVRNLIYNFHENPNGNPRGVNFMFNRVRLGPQSDPAKAKVWQGKAKPGEAIFPNSVYTEGNVSDGFAYQDSYLTGSRRTTPFGTPSVTASAAPSVEEILSAVGPTTGRNSQEQSLIEHVRNRTDEGAYFTGPGTGTPNLAWPTNP